ncbi:hypothetical protein ACFO9E_27480 [Streptomyces maoxianensis]|uniref:Uncharacterized protein n=1 Tax=Streptomyces maoxianensis TaxID=1459942 RepID=A0ABV9GBL5_9ACTN
MSAENLHRLEPALRILAQMAGPFGFLPTTDVAVRTTYRPDEFGAVIVISVHDGLADFEAWREALGIRPEDVTFSLLPSVASLRAQTEWGGAWIEVHGYGPLPTNASEPAKAVAA